MKPWVEKNTFEGESEQAWSFAGQRGGGGIVNVVSLDELDAVMGEFPWWTRMPATIGQWKP